MQQAALGRHTDARHAIRWLHSELGRILSDLRYRHQKAQADSGSGGAMRLESTGPGHDSESHVEVEWIAGSSLGASRAECARGAKEQMAARLQAQQMRLQRLTRKAHVSQHCRFHLSQETYKLCRTSHTSPQMLRAWARLAQAVFCLPLPPHLHRSLARAVNRLRLARCLGIPSCQRVVLREGASPAVKQPSVGMAFDLTPKPPGCQETHASTLLLTETATASASAAALRAQGICSRARRALALAWSWWCDAQSVCLSRRACKEAAHCTASAWSCKLRLASMVLRLARVPRLSFVCLACACSRASSLF